MNGLFQGVKSGTAIAKFVKDELFPVTKQIRELSIEISQFRAGFFESFLRLKARDLENEYKKLSINFINLYNKWSTPDILYKDLNINSNDPNEFGPAMNDYFQSQQAVMWHFNESFRLLSYVDGILTEQTTASYNRISVGISLFAIAISIILGVFLKK